MKRPTLDTVTARTLLVLIIGLSVSHVLSVMLYSTDRSSAVGLSGAEHIGDHVATIDRLVRGVSGSERQRIVALADGPTLGVTLTTEAGVVESEPSDGELDVFRHALRRRLQGGDRRAVHVEIADQFPGNPGIERSRGANRTELVLPAMLASIRQGDGTWLNVAAPLEPVESLWSLRFVLSMSVMLLAVGALSILVVRHLTKPLEIFSAAAQRLGRDVKASPLPVSGPLEVRQAIAAFNEMQRRVGRFVEDRTQMIAAISHDLGTPITRLRLRAEFIDDKDQQKKMLQDLDEMEKMVFATLSFARDEAVKEPRANVEIGTMLQRVCDGIQDAGYRVTLRTGDEPLPYACRPAALRRALANIVENAAKYGHCARVSLSNREDDILIRVEDDGPGVPDVFQEDIFKPFRRLESSRNRETGGVGLGLTVARSIIRAHGGGISLENRPEGGLRVDVCLPR